MKKIGIMQPYLFPYLGYFQLINAVDEYVIYDDVQFIKGGWVNRNNVLIDGKKTLITLPLSGASPNKAINQINIVRDKAPEFLTTLEMAYAGSPNYSDTMQILNEILSFDNDNLGAFVGNSIERICTYLNINTTILYSSNIEKNNTLKAQDKVIDICTRRSGNVYINAAGGVDLYSSADFKAEGISLHFLKSRPIPYKQLGSPEFVPNLSIIDVLMANKSPALEGMLLSYEIE